MKPLPGLALAWLTAGFAFAQPSPAPAIPGAGRGLVPAGTQLATQLFNQADRNADRHVSREELAALADNLFNQLDPDRTGRVTQEEFLQRFDALISPTGGGRRGGRGPGLVGGSSLGLFTVIDRDHDAELRAAELKQAFTEWVAAWDTDHDGQLSLEEMTKGMNSVLPRTNLGTDARQSEDAPPGLPTPPPSPVLSPAASMATIRLVDGFKIELAASEPMIEDPIALSFDADGRAYVVEMRGYMLDIDRAHERDPVARISRLEDTDGDGRFDRATVFVDGLIQPRAVAAIGDGVFYVSDYQLYFARDTNGDGKADETTLVDPDYGRGNVEHAPNGFFRAMDNWIYNGESPHRYRLVGKTLVRETTEQRGQWGMTQDNYGRLIYDVNNSQLMGDYAPPNYMGRNAHHPSTAGLNLFVSTDQRVFPIRMNLAINRGYAADVLDSEGRAFVFASSCAPVVYRGDNFPAEFVGNAFVADPALNLIKRNVVFERNLTLASKFAYADREFLAATDERFRPVSLYGGPDGALWVVDLYRGIAQYGQFMTPYLRKDTLARGLDQGVHFGRIYRVVSATKPANAFPKLSAETSAQLVTRLAHANGWIRDTAQRLLVERGDRSIVPALVKLVGENGDTLARIHALWTLEGLFMTVPDADAAPLRLRKAAADFSLEARDLPADVYQTVLRAIAAADPKLQTAAIRVAESFARHRPEAERMLLATLERLPASTPAETLFQAALTAGNLPKPAALPFLVRVLSTGAEHLLIRDGVLSGLQDWELSFLQLLLADPKWNDAQSGRAAFLQELAGAILRERQPAKIELLRALTKTQTGAQAWRQRSLQAGIAAVERVQPATVSAPARKLTGDEAALIAEGKNLFQQLCAGCHGLAGQGAPPMAPPLANSEWVAGAEARLIRIVLHGVTGPISVAGTTYQPPNVLPEMPPLASLDDVQLAAVLSFVRRSWGQDAPPVASAAVAAVRAQTVDRKTPWTETELHAIK